MKKDIKYIKEYCRRHHITNLFALYYCPKTNLWNCFIDPTEHKGVHSDTPGEALKKYVDYLIDKER